MAAELPDEKHQDDGADGQEVQEIAECVRNEAAHQDETSPDGLAYHVDTFELEVERFLEVDSWNDIHGIEETDQIEEQLVQEMKDVQDEGNKRRAVIKQGFEAEESQLGKMEEHLKELASRIDSTKFEAEKAARADIDQISIGAGASGQDEGRKVKASAKKTVVNPYSEYKEQMKLLEGKTTKAPQGTSLPTMDNSGDRSRIEKLRAEAALLKQCMQKGPKGDFSEYSTRVAGK